MDRAPATGLLTIHRYLKEIGEEEGPATGSRVAVSEAIQDLVGRLAARVNEEAEERVTAAQSKHAEQLTQHQQAAAALKTEAQSTRQQLEQTQRALAEEKTGHGKTSEALSHKTLECTQLALQVLDLQALGAALEAKDQQIADLVRQLTALQKNMVGREGEVEQLRAHIAATTSALQAERGRLDALTEEHRLERGSLEQRASAHEKRLLEDVDRTRQEAKRLKLLLAEENKKASQELTGSQEQVQLLRVEVGALRSENAGLAREILSARENLRTTQSQQDQLRKDTVALLADLKARLPKVDAQAGTSSKRSKPIGGPKQQ